MKYTTNLILIGALLTGQLHNVVSQLTKCQVGACNCSVASQEAGICCCSGEGQTHTCCSSKSTNQRSCCASTKSAEVNRDSSGRSQLCSCGCNDRSVPARGPAEERITESLSRLISQVGKTVDIASAESLNAPSWPPVEGNHFYVGLSKQPLFCLWLI